MVWNRAQEDFPTLKKQIEDTAKDIALLKDMKSKVDLLVLHQAECDKMHTQHLEHRKRNDDAINNNTQSNMLLAQSINKMNITVAEFTKTVEDGRPVIEFWKNVNIASKVNGKIVGAVIGALLTVAALIAAYNSVFKG